MPLLSVAEANAILDDNFAPWVLALGIRAESVNRDGVTLAIPFAAELCRGGGTMSGQAIASGADTAMVLALAAALGALKPLTTVDMTVNFLRPIASADAILAAKVVRLGKSLAFVTCEVRERGADKIAAFASATYALLG